MWESSGVRTEADVGIWHFQCIYWYFFRIYRDRRLQHHRYGESVYKHVCMVSTKSPTGISRGQFPTHTVHCQRTIRLYSLCTKIICLFTARWHFSMYEHFFPWIDSSLWPNWTTIRFCSCSIFLGSMYKIHVICLSTATFWTSYPIFWHFLFVTRIYLVCGQLNTIDFVYSGVKRNAK